MTESSPPRDPATCPLCRAPLRQRYEKDGYRVGGCPDCDVMAVMDAASEQLLDEFYNQEKTEEYRRRYRDKKREGKWRRRLALVHSLRGDAPPGSILDVGCSFGAFLGVAQDAGWRTCGIEITEDGIATCRERLGHDRVYRDLSSLTEPEAFDVVCLWDLIEHLPDPRSYLDTLHVLLQPGGLLAVTTVNVGAWNRRWFGARWTMFEPPVHLVYFSVESLKQAMRQTGFEPVYESTWFLRQVMWQSIHGKHSRPGIPVRVLLRVIAAPIGLAARLFGGGDNMMVIARKTA